VSDGADGILRAGGLAPPTTEPSEPADAVRARRYRHPALGDRPVVRLVAEPLARAEDLTLGRLGLELESASEPVALVRRRALGFPGWVLLHHPDDADTALAVVDAMASLARLARSRPGAAKDGYEAIAGRLARAVPHFLPTYFEEAGRAFVDAGSPAQAGVMFGKAREAERVYALEVDEERRLAVFVEFALAGALTARSLADYARRLGESRGPAAAYATFRRLCVERTRAGLPPWSEMATHLRRLGAAAGADLDADERALVADLLDAPALTRAPAGFWRAYRRPLLELARGSPAVRRALLDLQPRVAGIHDWWLSLLDGAGALDALTAPAAEVPPGTEPSGGAAGWLARMALAATADWRSPGVPDALFALLPRMARRLRADGTPVRLAGRDDWQTDLDLLDLALELQVPVEPPGPETSLHLTRWLGRPEPRRRDLDHVAADPTWGPLLLDALDDDLGRVPAGRVLAGGHLRRGFAAWLDRMAERIDGGGLPDLVDELGRLGKVLDPDALDVNPAARDRILAADAARSLARTLRGGSLDELGWPALERARARLGANVTASGSWPNLVVSDGVRAIVVGPDDVLMEHDLRTGSNPNLRQLTFLYAGGQLLVSWWVPGAGRRAYWSGRPAEVFDPRSLPTGSWSAPLALSLELEDGSRTSGGRAVRAGDTAGGVPNHMAADGSRCWTLVDGRFHELDPATGRTGRASLPAFLAGAGGALVAASSWVMPLPQDVRSGPLGDRDGLVGLRVRRLDDGRYAAEGTDGRRVVAALPEPPVALVALPGDDAPRPVSLTWHRLHLWDPTGRFRLLRATTFERGPDLARATPMVPPPPYWIALRPRDEAGSAALRAVTDDVARGLLAAAEPARAVEELLPAITDPDLRRSVAALAEVAADAQGRLEKLLAGLRAAGQAPAGPPDALLLPAFAPFRAGPPFHGAAPGSSAARQFAMVERFMESGDLPGQFTSSPVQWAVLAGRMAAVAYRAASAAVEPDERAALLEWLERWAGSIVARHPEWFRVVLAVEGPGSTLSPVTWIRHRGGHRWFISAALTAYQEPTRRLILERAHRGRFDLPPDMTVEWQRPAAGARESPDRLRRLVALVRERGPVPWAPERAERLARATGLTRAEAALLLAGLPFGTGWSRGFLAAGTRRLLGLKAAEVAVAWDRLTGLPVEARAELVAAAMPDDPADLWRPRDDPAARVAEVWLRTFGRRPEVDDSLTAAARSALRLARPARPLAGFAEPAADPRLDADAVWVVDPSGRLHAVPGGPAEPFDGQAVDDLALLIPWLFAARPAGDPARSGIPAVLERARRRLANPDLLVFAGWGGPELGGRSLLDLVPGPGYRSPRGAEVPDSRDAGAFVLVAAGQAHVRVHVRPARIDPEADAGVLALLDDSARRTYARVAFLRGEAGDLAERVLRTPLPAGGWEANPAASVPALVVEAAAESGLGPEAAALYLQLLAGPDPTVRRIREWNGWDGPAFERAARVLVDRGLAIRARRPRAGRDLFLPGPWEDLKAPDLPVESWRLRLYGGRPLGRLLALRPLHRLFEEAWRLVASGKGPGYPPQEIRTPPPRFPGDPGYEEVSR
jgi:hypothetical protein